MTDTSPDLREAERYIRNELAITPDRFGDRLAVYAAEYDRRGAELGWLRQVAETARSAVLSDDAEERAGALEELRLLIEEGMT